MALVLQDTPEQQAALAHLGTARPAFIEAYRQIGRIGPAAQAVGISRRTADYWLANDPEFSANLAEARLDLTDRLAAKGIQAVLDADSDTLIKHPNLYFHEMNYLEPGRRPNAAVQIDARSITVNTLDEATATRLARALAGASDSEDIA